MRLNRDAFEAVNRRASVAESQPLDAKRDRAGMLQAMRRKREPWQQADDAVAHRGDRRRAGAAPFAPFSFPKLYGGFALG